MHGDWTGVGFLPDDNRCVSKSALIFFFFFSEEHVST